MGCLNVQYLHPSWTYLLGPNSNCIQYENDSTIDWTCKINQKDTCMKDLKRKPQLRNCQSTNLVFNTGKTKNKGERKKFSKI